ncbi:hypothetical protein PSACC_00737 [Paramicrosporidium saccamoebae]|uniref:Hyaluronan/mRNA-binding protein domain-containing protein n=1 Tax=Paramicrosporidium saccamoebae TaxID=1246581 RepID=A0A2H9TNY3_9FUNG|nr:hypothetical protein PSACC_00737 [Paramicrosporidium saccamoebae]
MNRFHLLSLEEEETSAPTAPIQTTKDNKDTNKGAKTQDATVKKGGKAPARMERRSRGVSKGEGQKHQTVGKGSWGRHTDGALPEEGAAVADEATNDETAEPPKPAYKTVKQYLAEQEQHQKRLSQLPQLNVRHANEGVEMEDMEVVRKEAVAGNAATKKTTNLKEPVKKTLSLQELNKVLPPAERRPREQQESRGERREENDRRPRQNDDRRASQKTRDAPAKASVKIDLSDKTAFPSLA